MPSENMRIQSTILGYQAHASVLSIGLVLERGGTRQPLIFPLTEHVHFPALLRQLLLISGTSAWEHMKSQWVRVERDEAGNLARIGHIGNEDWLEIPGSGSGTSGDVSDD